MSHDLSRIGLGHVPRVGPPLVSAAPLAAIPRSEWREFDLTTDPHPIQIKMQGAFGACNGHAAATSAEWARWLAGMTPVALSAWYVYAILCGGRDAGSNIGQALQLLSDRGTCPEPDVPWGTIDPRHLTAASVAHATSYRAEVGSMLSGFDAIMSAVQLRRPGNVSVRAVSGSNFVTGPEGVARFTPGPGDHAVALVPGAKRTRNGEWAVKIQNSWSEEWGEGGYAWITRRHIEEQSYFEGYTLAAMCDAPGDPTNPPPVS